MGLFSDKCRAIVSLETKRCLTGAELAEAKRILAEEKGLFHSAESVLARHGWGFCGHDVKKKARFCSKCGAPAPGGWTKCPSCGKWVGNEMTHCWNCNHELHPDVRADIGGGVWSRAEGLFAQRFEVGEVENMLKNGVQVQEGSVAILLDAGEEKTVIGPGRHEPAGTLRSINWFGNPPPRSFVLVDAGEFIVPLRMTEGLVTAENYPISVYAELTLRFVRGRADDFMANFMKDSRSITYEELANTLSAVLVYAIKDLCTTSTVEDLVKDPGRRDQFEATIRKVAGETLKAWGFDVVRVGAADFDSPKYRELENQNADYVEKRRQLEFLQKIRGLLNEDAEKNRELDSKEREIAMGVKMDNAKADLELFEYTEQLAQEKEISIAERDNELKLILMAKQHEITVQEANYKLAEKIAARAAEMEDEFREIDHDIAVKERIRAGEMTAEEKELDHDIALKEKLRAYTVDAMLKDELGQEELCKIKAREAEISQSVERSEIDLEAYRKITIAKADADAKAYEIRVIGIAQTDVDADRIRRVGEAEAAVEAAKNGVKIKTLEGLQTIDERIDESKRKTFETKVGALRDASIETQIAMADSTEKLNALVEVTRIKAQAVMTSDQHLGVAAQNSAAAAEALATIGAANAHRGMSSDQLLGVAAQNNAAAAEALGTIGAANIIGDRERALYDTRAKETREDRDKVLDQDKHIVDTVAGIAQNAVYHGEKSTVVGTWSAGTGVGYQGTTTTPGFPAPSAQPLQTQAPAPSAQQPQTQASAPGAQPSQTPAPGA